MFDVVWSDSWTLATISLAILLIAGLVFAWASRRSRSDGSSADSASPDRTRWHWPRWGAGQH